MDVATAWLVYAGTEHLMTLPPGGPGGALRGRRVLRRPDRQPSHPACVLKWSYFVGQSEGKAKVDSDWF